MATSSGQASGTNNNNNNNNDNSDGNARSRGSRNRRGGRGNNNNNNINTTRGPFKGKVTNLHGFIYDVGLPNSNNDLFSKTTKEIAEHVSRTIEGAGDFRLAMVNLVFPTLAPPAAPADAPGMNEPSWVDKEQFKLQYPQYIRKYRLKYFLWCSGNALAPSVTAWRQARIGRTSTQTPTC
jgi:hypothetical protein